MEIWRKCSSCKKDIARGAVYYVCSVSTCRGSVTNYVFCSIPCWDAHVPVERHRADSAGALERRAPKVGEPEPGAEPRRKIITSTPAASVAKSAGGDDELLVVVSKVRKYVADRSGMNTSASLYDALTQRIKLLCDMAIEQARTEGRKTVMDRDLR